ncbi:Response regulator receiver domain-containing protein [Polaromonas sp. YR568]|uniref:response regulator transcription factor n=1 Tax=Polaromonas sp. YR568 TaxID=1855301 RepID=UPI0008E18F60|nr:response regulator [Polaromonas sp. YR568]SFV00425.1 Response regulator receiver domain-containing protein [Polaromonas sp. YR568]
MHSNDIYAVTPKGQQELRGAATTISPEEVELLVRLDGILSIGQIRQSVGGVAGASLEGTMSLLYAKGLVELVPPDPFASSLQLQLSPSALTAADAEADFCAATLKKSNYYVRIARKRETPRQRAPGERLSAIIVDDEETLAKFLHHYLTFEGFDVRIAGSRAEVVAEFRKPPIPDLVLLDVMLPDADGFDILLRIRSHPQLKDVPVIMLTAKATREAVLKGLASGADGYVTKPVETESLLQAVRTVLGSQ